MSVKTLNDRVLEAKALAREANILKRDKHNRASVIMVPGSKATLNRVIIRRRNGGIIETECHKITGIGDERCLGNISGICRHSLAAIIVALEDQGYSPRFRKDETAAEKFLKANEDVCYDRVWIIRSFQGRGQMFMVAVDKTALALKQEQVK